MYCHGEQTTVTHRSPPVSPNLSTHVIAVVLLIMFHVNQFQFGCVIEVGESFAKTYEG